MVSFRSLFLLFSSVAAMTEYIGLVPVSLCCSYTNDTVKWAKLQYASEGVSSVEAVEFSIVEEPEEALGEWFDFKLPENRQDGYGALLTARVHGDKLFLPLETRSVPYRQLTTGCCADKMRITDKSTGDTVVFDTQDIIDEAFEGSGVDLKGNSHTFDVMEDEESAAGLLVVLNVQYFNTTINRLADAIVIFDAESGELRRTANGDGFFDMAGFPGTILTEQNETIFKVQYVTQDASNYTSETWHQNGVLRFFSKAEGQYYLAITHYMHHEAVVLLDPYTYTSSAGGGEVVQRFGTPSVYDSNGDITDWHFFGLDPALTTDLFTDAVHNVFYTQSTQTESLAGRETLTIFVNNVYNWGISIQEEDSYAYEFAFNPVRQQDLNGTWPLDDSVFSTNFSRTALGFQVGQQGGVRPIGNGVYVSSTGLAAVSAGYTKPDGMVLVDSIGGFKSISYGTSNSFYDSFVRVIDSVSNP